MSIRCLPDALPGIRPPKSNVAIARMGSSTLKSHIFLNALLKLVEFYLRKMLWNFGYSHREDTGQAMSWGRSLANSSPASWTLTLVRARQLSGEKVVPKPASYYFSLQQNFYLGDLHNELGFRNNLFLLIQATELKTKEGSWLVKHER